MASLTLANSLPELAILRFNLQFQTQIFSILGQCSRSCHSSPHQHQKQPNWSYCFNLTPLSAFKTQQTRNLPRHHQCCHWWVKLLVRKLIIFFLVGGTHCICSFIIHIKWSGRAGSMVPSRDWAVWLLTVWSQQDAFLTVIFSSRDSGNHWKRVRKVGSFLCLEEMFRCLHKMYGGDNCWSFQSFIPPQGLGCEG